MKRNKKKMTAAELSSCVILPASGIGERFGADPPKQYSILLDKPLVLHALNIFHRLPWVTHIIVPVNKTYLSYVQELVAENHYEKVTVIEGSHSRHRSIYTGVLELRKVCPEPDVVIIQDIVRIFADEDIIREVAVAAKTYGAAGVTRPLVSTVISPDSDGFLEESLDRSKYCASEMPQGFIFTIILTAYQKSTVDDFDHGTECLLLAMKYTGTKAKLIQGPDSLWKVTYRKDLYAAEGMLKESHIKVLVCDTVEASLRDLIQKACRKKRLKVVSKSEGDETPNSFVSHCRSCDLSNTVQNTTGQLFQENGSGQCMIKPFVILMTFGFGSEDQTKFREICHDLGKKFKKKGLINGILIQDEVSCHAQAADMIASLLWNRDVTLSGQVLNIRA